MEAVETKFPVQDGARRVIPGTVGINDGFNKIITMYGVALICHKLETWCVLCIFDFEPNQIMYVTGCIVYEVIILCSSDLSNYYTVCVQLL